MRRLWRRRCLGVDSESQCGHSLLDADCPKRISSTATAAAAVAGARTDGGRKSTRCLPGPWPRLRAKLPLCRRRSGCTGLDPGWQSRHVTVAGRTQLSGAAIKEWIATRGPVTGCFVVFSDFMVYQGGIYRHVSGDELGGHCVSLIGYDDVQSCWIAKNSWGPAWGESGFSVSRTASAESTAGPGPSVLKGWPFQTRQRGRGRIGHRRAACSHRISP